VCRVPARVQLAGRIPKRGIVSEGAQQFIVARAWFVRAGQNRVDDMHRRCGADSAGRHRFAGDYGTMNSRRVFERAHHGSPDGDDAISVRAGAADGCSSRFGNPIRLVEGKQSVEFRVARGGNAGGVRQRRESNPSRGHCREHSPVQRKAGGRRLKGNRGTRNWRPHIPQCKGRRNVRVLNGPAVARQALPNLIWRAVETYRCEPRVIQQAPYSRTKWSQHKLITRAEHRWKRPVLGTNPEIPCAEYNCRKVTDVIGRQRAATCEADFDNCTGGRVDSCKAGRERCGVVSNHQIAGPQQIDKP